jgi:uncharacterized protein
LRIFFTFAHEESSFQTLKTIHVSVLVIFLAVLIGVSLGLIGGGGSILTVPVLVYVAGVSPTLATAYSLFIVGSTSLVGGCNNMRKQLVHVPTAVIFSIPSAVWRSQRIFLSWFSLLQSCFLRLSA